MMAYKVQIPCWDAVPLYNNGQMHRDWTFVDDIVAGITAATEHRLGYEVMNLGRGEPALLADFVESIEEMLGRKANLEPALPPDTDILSTHADTSKAQRLLGYDPKVSVREGVALPGLVRGGRQAHHPGASVSS